MQSNVVIIEPSSAGLKLIDASLALNTKVHLVTYCSDDRVVPKHYLDQCEVIFVDTNNEIAMRKELEVLNSKKAINAIIPGFEYYVPSSARLNAHFGLKGLPLKTADAMHFKHKMRQHLLDCGIKTPWFVVINTIDDIKKYKNHIRFPCVIKPSHLAGSLHITKINNMDELEFNLNQLIKDDFLDLGHKMSGDILIEEYISGRELSVEGYVDNGNVHFVSVTDKFLGEEPHFVEIGHIVKADITPEIEKLLLEYTYSVIKALDISLGPFHCEIRLSNKGPILIEVAARLVGDSISELIELATGISLATKMVKSYLGHQLQMKEVPSFRQYAGVKFIYAKDKSGLVFSHMDGVDSLAKISGFSRCGFLLEAGKKIYPFTDYRARVAEVIFTGSTHEEVKTKLSLAERILKVKTIGSS